jgi:hypothetical protein
LCRALSELGRRSSVKLWITHLVRQQRRLQDVCTTEILGGIFMANHSSRGWAAALCASLVACGGGGGGDSATPSTVPVPDTVTAFFASFDASRATAISPTGAGFYAMYDGCYFDSGRSKTSLVSGFDGDSQRIEANNYRVGSTRNALRVLADRASTNPDGSSRREIDITYNITYADGTVDTRSNLTLVYGSSTGSTLPSGSACTTPENKAEWRFYGDRRVVATSVSARNDRLERYFLVDGSAHAPAVAYSKYILLTVEDPGRYATYAIVSGPGVMFSNGVPMSLKLLSPRLLRDDPLLAGKRGNYVDAGDGASFGICRTSTDAYADAPSADCVQYGASGSAWGAFNWPTGAEADQSFDRPALVAGGVYTVKVYNDDGWKTVNGQAGKTPVATYTATLKHLPYSAAALAGIGTGADLFPRYTSLSKTKAEIATAIRQKAAIAIDAVWSAPGAMPDGSQLGLGSLLAYESGQANSIPAEFPASRNSVQAFPAKGSTQLRLPSPTPGSQLVTPTYAELGLFYTTRDGNTVLSVVNFY